MALRRLLGGGVVVALIMVAGCGGGAEDATTQPPTTVEATTQPPTTVEATTTTETVPVTEAEPVLVSEELAELNERSVVFGNVEFTITGARISNQELRSYAEGSEPVVDEENLYAILDITAHNMMSSSQTEGLDVATYKLLVGDDELAAATEMSFLSELTGIIRPATAVDSFLAFPVAEGIDLAGATLQIGVTPDRKAVLPLTGLIPPDPYPLAFELTGSAEGVGPTNGGTIVFTVLDGTLSDDLPLEHANSPTGQRADEGELFLVIHVQAEKVEGRGNDLLFVDAFRLLVDGVPRSPWDSATDPLGSNDFPTAEPGAVEDLWVAFIYPIDATELALQAGDLEEGVGVIPIVIP